MATKPKTTWADQVRELEVGETLSRTKRIAVDEADTENVNEAIANLRNTVNQGVSKLRTSTGRNFRTESTVAVTDDRAAFLCTVAITRLDGEGNEETEIDDDDVDI